MERTETAGDVQPDIRASDDSASLRPSVAAQALSPTVASGPPPSRLPSDPWRGWAPQRRADGSRVTQPPRIAVAATSQATPTSTPGASLALPAVVSPQLQPLPPGELESLPWDTHPAAEDEKTPLYSHKVVREVVETALLAILVFLAVRATFQNYRVEGHSMDPTLQDGEFLLVNKLLYSQVNVSTMSKFIPFLNTSGDADRDVFHGPQRGDIIVLDDPRGLVNEHLVKRVIGLPGETFEIVNGHVYINGRLLDEPYITQPWDGSTPKETIPAGDYFVMGDNRQNSWDSRFFGLVPRELIVGKAQLSYWPFSKFGEPAHASPKLAATVTRP